MGTYNTAYKSGTVSSISGTTLTVSGMTLAAGDVGRLVVVNSGAAALQHREILAVSGSDITLAHPMDESPFLGVDDVNPSSGDTIVISYLLDDLIATDADITEVNNRDVSIGALVATDGAYIFCTDKNITFDSQNIESGREGGFIFGYYSPVPGEDAYTRNSCAITDTASGVNGNQMGVSTSDFGMVDIYGGSVAVPASAGNFWRAYDTDASTTQCRWINVTMFGSFGSRVDGDRSILVITSVGSASTTGVCNPRSAVARVEITALDSLQGAYVWLAEGANGRAVFARIADVTGRVLRISTAQAFGASGVYEVLAKKSEVDQVPALAVVAGNVAGGNNHTIRYGNLVKPNFVNVDTSALTDTVRTILRDDLAVTVNSDDVTDGQYPATFVRHTDIVTGYGVRNLSDGTQYAPYVLMAVSWGKTVLFQTLSVEDTFDAALTMLNDPLITELDKAAVDAYTELNDPRALYDRQLSWLLEDYAHMEDVADLGALPGIRVGNSVEFDGLDVVLDDSAAEVYDFDGTTVFVRSSVWMGDVTTTGVTDFVGAAYPTASAFTGDIAMEAVQDLTDVTVGGKLILSTPGEFTLTGCDIAEVENVSGGSIILNLSNTPAPILTETSGTITTQFALRDLTVTGAPAGAEIRIYDLDGGLGDLGTELAGVESHVGGDFTWTHQSPDNAIIIQVMATGFLEQNIAANTGPAATTVAITLEPELNL